MGDIPYIFKREWEVQDPGLRRSAGRDQTI
jgi:hypothetical protein